MLRVCELVMKKRLVINGITVTSGVFKLDPSSFSQDQLLVVYCVTANFMLVIDYMDVTIIFDIYGYF